MFTTTQTNFLPQRIYVHLQSDQPDGVAVRVEVRHRNNRWSRVIFLDHSGISEVPGDEMAGAFQASSARLLCADEDLVQVAARVLGRAELQAMLAGLQIFRCEPLYSEDFEAQLERALAVCDHKGEEDIVIECLESATATIAA